MGQSWPIYALTFLFIVSPICIGVLMCFLAISCPWEDKFVIKKIKKMFNSCHYFKVRNEPWRLADSWYNVEIYRTSTLFFFSPKHAYSDEIELFIMPADWDCVFKDNRIKVLAFCISLLFRDRSQGTFSLFDFAACQKRDFWLLFK